MDGRTRWQPSTHQWFGFLAIVAWRTTKNNGKAHCPSTGTVESQKHRSELGCQLGQAFPEKP